MYLGIDVGGTKTLVASLDDSGVILESQKFPTPQNYQDFLIQLSEAIEQLTTYEYRATGIGIPATSINRREGIAISFANLAWKNVPILQDIEKLVNTPVALENDAKLAGLSEAKLRQDIHRLLYVTVSTGIGYSLIVNQKIDHNIGDGGGSLLILEHQGKLVPWESFASGKAIVKTFGLKARDISSPDVWDKIADNLVVGILELIAVTEPDLIVIGGSVGVYLDQFKKPLKQKLETLETPLLKIPPLEAAQRPEEAVIYGCYDYAKELYGSN
jgi:predicted NBD/HSP70 family sugar kinase